MTDQISRRHALRTTAALAAGGLAGSHAFGHPPQGGKPAPRTEVFRLVHMTDVHVQPERDAASGLVACLRHIRARTHKPQMILAGGDNIMDAFEQNEGRSRQLFDLWRRVVQDECDIPIEHCIGNHDVWGWNKTKSGCTGSEMNYGKNWAVEVYGIGKRYRSFDMAGWHFVVLDSTHPDPANTNAYIARLDDEQFEWLAGDLASTKLPTLILSHMPILTVTTLVQGEAVDEFERLVKPNLMHVDCRRLLALFAKHPHVKLCLSGHIHELDRVDFNGVSYLCNGAVSGAWWKGRHNTCDEGYAALELFPDGSFHNEYVRYGWQAKA